MDGVDDSPFELISDDFLTSSLVQRSIEICDESSGASSGDDDALLLELTIGFGDGVGIDHQSSGEVADRRQPIVFDEFAEGNVAFDLIDDLTTRATVIWPWELDFEDFMLVPSATEIFEGLSQVIIRSSILNCFMEAAVSEHLSRVVCMRNASDNAEEMIKELSKEYNRARQGQITVELLDIVSGVEAMK